MISARLASTIFRRQATTRKVVGTLSIRQVHSSHSRKVNTAVQSLNQEHVSEMSETEWNLRVDLAAAYRLADMHGWTDLIGTHISARVPGEEDSFLINPYGLMYDEIKASNLVKVDQHGNILSDTPHRINPAGFVIHSAVHMARPDVICAVHTHTVAGTAVATQSKGLLPLTHHAMKLYENSAYHGYEGISTDLSERERIAHDLNDKNVLFLRNHGLLSVGRSVGEAFVWMFRAERACEMQLAIQQSGADVFEMPDDVQQTTLERNRKATSSTGHRPVGKLEWPALLRKLNRIDQSYTQ